MNSLNTTPLAEFFKLYFALNKFFIFGTPIVYSLAFGALEFYQAVLGHSQTKIPYMAFLRNYLPVFDTCQCAPEEPAVPADSWLHMYPFASLYAGSDGSIRFETGVNVST